MTKTEEWSVFGAPVRELPGPPKRRTATPPTTVPHPSTLQVVPDVDAEPVDSASAEADDQAPVPDVAPLPGDERDDSQEQPAPETMAPAHSGSATKSRPQKVKTLGLGSNLSYKEYAASQEAAKWVDRVLAALGRGGLETSARGAKLDKDLFTVQLMTADTGALMAALPEVVNEFECDDLDVSLVDDQYVRLRLPTGKGNAEQKAVWVPHETRELVRDRTSVTRESVTDVFMRAFNDLYDEMGEWFEGPAEEVAGPMTVSGRRRREGVGTQVQLYLYLTPIARARLEDAIETSNAGSRSALVTELLNRHLAN
jgi:hypothetical protein